MRTNKVIYGVSYAIELQGKYRQAEMIFGVKLKGTYNIGNGGKNASTCMYRVYSL